jgi:hypothetical protein
MNANTEVELGALHDAIVRDIQTAFPDLATVEFYRDDRKNLPAPACLLDLVEFEPSPEDDPGTEQLAVLAKFEASLVLGFRTDKAKLSARKLAAAFAAWLRLRRWSHPTEAGKKLPTGPAVVTGCFKDDFSPELDQFEVWTVEWSQIVHLGNTVWTDEGTTPTTVMAGFSPRIGAGEESEYTQVTE